MCLYVYIYYVINGLVLEIYLMLFSELILWTVLHDGRRDVYINCVLLFL